MTVSHSVVTVATTATALNTVASTRNGQHPRNVRVQNQSGAAVFIGGTGVTTSAYGYKLAATTGEVTLTLDHNDVVYGIVASATSAVSVLFTPVV